MTLTRLTLALALACYPQPSEQQREAQRLQHEDGERGCALPGRVTAIGCEDGTCLVCHEAGGMPAEAGRATLPPAAVCVTMTIGGCR